MHEERGRLTALRDRLFEGIRARVPDVRLNGHPTERLPGTANISYRGVESESVVLGLDLKGIGVSAGSACTSGNVEPSYVLVAMGAPVEWALGAVPALAGSLDHRRGYRLRDRVSRAGGAQAAGGDAGGAPREVQRHAAPGRRRRRAPAPPGRSELMFDALRGDIRTVMERDPAARSRLEVLCCYPGVHALALHRLGNRFWRAGWLSTARFVSHVARFFTGIEIHPAARLGRGLFIDHGMGIVIGEPPRSVRTSVSCRA
jgi:hypothetical protein